MHQSESFVQRGTPRAVLCMLRGGVPDVDEGAPLTAKHSHKKLEQPRLVLEELMAPGSYALSPWERDSHGEGIFRYQCNLYLSGCFTCGKVPFCEILRFVGSEMGIHVWGPRRV